METPVQPLQDNDKMPFGKHKGVPMVKVSAFYLIYLYDNNYIPANYPEVRRYIMDNMEALKKELKGKR